MKSIGILAGLGLLLLSCGDAAKNFDATGAFEAEETIISSEANGTILQFNVEEGQELKAGEVIGYVDSTILHLKKVQLEQQITSLLGRKPNIAVQIAGLQAQLESAKTERARLEKLIAGNAAPAKQMDDVNTQINVLERQIAALNSSLSITTEGITNDAGTLKTQLAQVEEQLKKCRLVNPIQGTVLTKYAEANELAGAGKPLYKIADLRTIVLRAYITGDQLPKVKLNQKVRVFTDDGNGKMKETEGRISWISSKAEFTPKTIQTKDERANLVYAIKVEVTNDGSYKIGMYGEVKFH